MWGAQGMTGGGCWARVKSHSSALTPMSERGTAPTCSEGWAGAAGPLGAPWWALQAPPAPHFHRLGAVTPPAVCPTLWLSSRDGKLFQVLLGAHSLTEPEPHKRLYRVRAQFPHPGSNIHNNKDDLLLLQVGWRLMGPSCLAGTVPFLQILRRKSSWSGWAGFPCPSLPVPWDPPKTFELCPNASIVLLAPALLSGCIPGLR